jgi:sensor domain CHASE-containing protein
LSSREEERLPPPDLVTMPAVAPSAPDLVLVTATPTIVVAAPILTTAPYYYQ